MRKMWKPAEEGVTQSCGNCHMNIRNYVGHDNRTLCYRPKVEYFGDNGEYVRVTSLCSGQFHEYYDPDHQLIVRE